MGQNFRRTKFVVGQNFRHQAEISTILSDEFLSDKVTDLDLAREVERNEFVRRSKRLSDLLSGDVSGTVRSIVAAKVIEEIRYLFQRCKMVHSEYVYNCKRLDATFDADGDEWLEDIVELYNNVIRCATMYVGKDTSAQFSNSGIQGNCEIKLPRIPLPEFNGNVKDFPRFKADFKTYVRPRLNKSVIAYVLKSCLTGPPLETVKNLADNEEVVWNRLEEKYGQPSKLIDSVLFELHEMKQLTDIDMKGMEKFATVIESAQTDLQRVGLEHELSNAYVINELEKKLPPKVRREWSLLVQGDSSLESSEERFKVFADFIMVQRRAVEYGNSKVRTDNGDSKVIDDSSGKDTQFRCDHAKTTSDRGSEMSLDKCVIHRTDGHSLSRCNEFVKLSPRQRLEIITKHRCCWSCLVPGHKASTCWYKKRCEVSECQRVHSPLLHEAHMLGIKFGSMS